MTTTPFFRIDGESLVVINTQIDGNEAFFAVDTGASHTVVDLNLLLIMGYDMSQTTGSQQFETANGVIEAHVFRVKKLDALGLSAQNVEVCAFDFLARGLASEFMGLLGLDFFSDHKICLDFQLSEITVS